MSKLFQVGAELNIGLESTAFSTAAVQIDADDANRVLFETIKNQGVSLVEYSTRVAQSNTERTLVCRIVADQCLNWDKVIFSLCDSLGQECISVLPINSEGFVTTGQLVGPNTENYGGKFDARYFIRFEAAKKGAAIYEGHLPNGNPVQAHSADDLYAQHGIVFRFVESADGKRGLWQALRADGAVFPLAHTSHDTLRFAVRALLTAG